MTRELAWVKIIVFSQVNLNMVVPKSEHILVYKFENVQEKIPCLDCGTRYR